MSARPLLLGTERVCQARWVFVGDDVEAFRDVYLRSFISVHERHRVEGRILDLSGGALWEAIREAAAQPGHDPSGPLHLGEEVAHDLKLLIASPQERVAALGELLSDRNPAIRPHQVICALSSVDAPLIEAVAGLIGPRAPSGPAGPGTLQMGALEDDELFAERLGNDLARIFDGGAPSCLVEDAEGWREVLHHLLARGPRTFGLILLRPSGTVADVEAAAFGGPRQPRTREFPFEVILAEEVADGLEDGPLVVRKAASLEAPSFRSFAKGTAQLLPVPDHYQAVHEDLVDEWWRSGKKPVLALTGLGGTGKTSLARSLARRVAAAGPLDRIRPAKVFLWDFYRSGAEGGRAQRASWTRPSEGSTSGPEVTASPDDHDSEVARCIAELGHHLTGGPFHATSRRHLQRIFDTVDARPDTHVLLILDGVERIAIPKFGRSGEHRWPKLLLDLLLRASAGTALRVLITSRALPPSLPSQLEAALDEVALPTGIPPEAAAALLRACDVSGPLDRLATLAAEKTGCNPLLTYQLGQYLRRFWNGDPSGADDLPSVRFLGEGPPPTGPEERANLDLVRLYIEVERRLEATNGGRVQLLRRLAALESGTQAELRGVFARSSHPRARGELDRMTVNDVEAQLGDLASLGLLNVVGDRGMERRYDMHPVVAQYFRSSLIAELDPGIDSRRREVSPSPRARAVRTRGTLSQGAVRVRGGSAGPRAPEPAAPTDPAALDAIEEILSRMVELGLTGAARRLFEEDVGGAEHLGSLGERERARRILRLLEAVHTR